jgi:hypothetical protein
MLRAVQGDPIFLCRQSDTTGFAGGLMSGVASKAINLMNFPLTSM